MNVGQFDMLMSQLQRIQEGQDLVRVAIRDAHRDPAHVNAILAALGEIRDRLPASLPTVTTVAGKGAYFVDAVFEPGGPVGPLKVPQRVTEDQTAARRAAWMREAFATVLDVLDDQIRDEWNKHREHRHPAEPHGQECWSSFHPQDFRAMVDTAARQLNVEARKPEAVPIEYRLGK